MKFSDIQEEQWPELKPYLDTCLLPLTGLAGSEEPWQATIALEQLRDALETIEIPFKGRVVTYPALHYLTGTDAGKQVGELSLQLKNAGFRFVIVLTIHTDALQVKPDPTDLLIVVDMKEWAGKQHEWKADIARQVQQLWQSGDHLQE